MAQLSTRVTAALAGAALIAASTVDPSPKRKVAELAGGIALMVWGAWHALKGGIGFLDDNPVLGPGGAGYVASWFSGIPGDIERLYQKPLPTRRVGEEDETFNRRNLEHLWEQETGSVPPHIKGWTP